MRTSKWTAVLALSLVLGLSLCLVAACGGSTTTSTGGGTTGGGMTGTPTENMTKILGHAPTGLAADIAKRGKIIVVDDANYPPQSYIDKNGNLIGFDVDVAKGLGTALGIPVKIMNAPWASVLSGIPVARFDVSIGSMTITKDRLKNMDFSTPYYYTQAQLIVKSGSPMLTTLDAMKGKSIGVGTGTTYAYYLDKVGGIKVKPYDTDASTFPDLKNGRLNGVMTADLTAAQAISSGFPFVFSGKPYYYEPLAFSIQKGQADWLALLDYAVKKMHDDGSLSNMAQKWYHFDPTKTPGADVPSYDQAYSSLP